MVGVPRSARRVLAAVVVVATAGVVTAATPAAAYPSASVVLTGHGYGHGHGMGQWGALGYAVAGTTWQGIVDHFYAGSSPAVLSAVQEAPGVRVTLTENDGNTVIVTSGSPFNVDGVAFGAGQAVFMAPNGVGWNLYSGASCAGPWSATPVGGAVDPVVSPATDPPLGDPAAATTALQLCQGGGNLTVRGSLEATYDSQDQPRTVNIVPLEEYVAGVVPNESPAYWGSLGGPGPQGQAWGFQELEAQAVAARSYVMAGLGSYGGYADTCDLSCQTYRGIANENPLTDAAVQDTAGWVMETNGVVQATQYSASTGGYTNPGTFAAVPDTGDAVCLPTACNPNHTWTTAVPVTTIEATWPQLGTLESVAIVGRNGYGDWGGRVTALTLVGSAQDVSLTGDAFAGALGLRSDWFTVSTSLGSATVAMAPTADGHGYWIAGADGSVEAFGDAAYDGSVGSALAAPVVGLAATPDGRGYWLVASDGGVFAFGDAGFYGSMGGRPLNRPVTGITPAQDGAGYRLVASDGGIFSFGGAAFYGSTGALSLVAPVRGMAPTPDGGGYWMVAADGGIFAFGDAGFYGSGAG